MKKLVSILLFFVAAALGIAQKTPYVILVSYDAFRWDYLNRGISPNLEKVREEGVSALSLRPAFPSKTFPNHLSIITGMYPEHHGILANHLIDPFSGQHYSMSDSLSVRDGRWYLGEAFWETAERQGIKTASFFWPGSEVQVPYRHPSYFEAYNHTKPYEQRIDGVIKWLQLPYAERPHFITAYFHETDDKGHKFGPDAPQTNEAIKRLDAITGYLLSKLDSIKMRDSINVVFVSDHGMTNVARERAINIEKIVNIKDCKFFDAGPIMFVTPSKENMKAVYETLKKNETHFKVYYKDEVPSYFYFNDHPYIAPIVVVADLGWSLVSGNKDEWWGKGDHGYDNNQLDMHGIFLASGPDFQKNYHTGTLWNIDIYPMLCKIFDIMPRRNIDGDINRIGFILK